LDKDGDRWAKHIADGALGLPPHAGFILTSFITCSAGDSTWGKSSRMLSRELTCKWIWGSG
jgi:hypothetical protein